MSGNEVELGLLPGETRDYLDERDVMKLGMQLTFTCDDANPRRQGAASAYDVTLSRYPTAGEPPREIEMAFAPPPCESVIQVGENSSESLVCAMKHLPIIRDNDKHWRN